MPSDPANHVCREFKFANFKQNSIGGMASVKRFWRRFQFRLNIVKKFLAVKRVSNLYEILFCRSRKNLEIESKIKLFQTCRIIEIAILCYGQKVAHCRSRFTVKGTFKYFRCIFSSTKYYIFQGLIHDDILENCGKVS